MQDFRVKTFLTVCRTLNYTRAAEELSITQPAVSQHIAYMEKEYGAKLFTYEGRKLKLTAAGLLLRNALAAMAHDDDLLHERVAALGSGGILRLRIGMTMTAGEFLVARPLARFLAAHPDTQVDICSGDTAHLQALLDAGDIDCAFVEGFFDRKPYAWNRFCTEKLVGLCAPERRFARKTVAYEELLGIPLIVREPGSGTRAVLEHALAARNLSVDAFAEVSTVDNLGIIKHMVAEDLGISFLYEAAARRELDEGSLVAIGLEGPAITHDISFIRLKGSVFEPEFKQLFEALATAST